MGDASWPMGVTHSPLFEAINLRIVFESGRTGFEEVKDFVAPIGTLIAGRYALMASQSHQAVMLWVINL